MLESYIPDLSGRYPDLRFTFQGEKKRISESFGSLYTGYPLAMIGIFFIIDTMFRSYIQPLLISITIPFGVIGAILGHLVLLLSFFMILNDLRRAAYWIRNRSMPEREAVEPALNRRVREANGSPDG